MPPEPQDTADPATDPFQRECWCGSWQGAPKHEYGTGRYCGEAQSIVVARLASAVGLPGAGVDDIEAAIGRLRGERDTAEQAFEGMTHVESMLRAEVARLRAENDDLRWLCGDELAREGQEMGLDTGTDDRDGGAHEPVAAGMLRGLASDLDRVVTSRKSKRQRVQAIQEVAADLRSLADLVPAPASPVPPAPDEARDEDDDCDLIEAVHQLQDEQADRFNCDPPGTAAAARKRIAEFNARDPFGPEEERPADCGFCTVQGKWFHINSSCGEHGDL